ncbi:hypothetical protein AB0B25_10335 [Nocardia sp. NPDC049190]|uniref:hypothetical protein n=1 Tax=Nocardia sp. NPDC049190 TaxID=3155650 RepID=UPI0033E75A5B
MTINTAARRLLTCAAIIGAITVGGAGISTAEPHGPSDPRNGTGDTTGWHHIDPMGFNHRDRSPLRTQQHNNALRDYHQRQSQPTPGNTGTGGNSSPSWSHAQRPDGSGYTVCKPQASWCR